MAKVEIDQAELDALRRVQGFADAALANPKTREDMLRINKALNPDKPIPELDATDRVLGVVKVVEEKLDGVLKTIGKAEEDRLEREAKAGIQSRIDAGQALLRRHNYTAEGIDKIEKLMLERGIGDYEAGMALFASLNPPSAPADASSSRWGSMSDQPLSPGNEDYKELFESQGQSENWLQNQLTNIRREFRQ